VWCYTWFKNSEEGGHQKPLITAAAAAAVVVGVTVVVVVVVVVLFCLLLSLQDIAITFIQSTTLARWSHFAKKKYKKTVPLVNTVQLRNITHKKGGFMHNDMTERGKLAVTINPGTTEVMHTSTATSIWKEPWWRILRHPPLHQFIINIHIYQSVISAFTSSFICNPLCLRLRTRQIHGK